LSLNLIMGSANSKWNACSGFDNDDRQLISSPATTHATHMISSTSTDQLLMLGSPSTNTPRILRSMEYHHAVATRNQHVRVKYTIQIRRMCVRWALSLYFKCRDLYKYNPMHYQMLSVESVDESIIQQLQAMHSLAETDAVWTNQATCSRISTCIASLWSMPPITCCWELLYSANRQMAHFLGAIDEIMDCERFVPSLEEILSLPFDSESNSNLCQIQIEHKNTKISIVSSNDWKHAALPKKLLHSLSPLTAIVFVVALDDFDVFDARKIKGNALRHALRVFGQIVNDKLFRDTSVILIFENLRVFRTKIVTHSRSLSLCFEDYVDDSDVHRNVRDSLNFVRAKFEGRVQNRNARNVYTHTVERYGSDGAHFKQIFNDVQHVKVAWNLDCGGLL